MQELEPTFQRALSVAWLLFWRGLIGALLSGFVLGVITLFMRLYFPFASSPGAGIGAVFGAIFLDSSGTCWWYGWH